MSSKCEKPLSCSMDWRISERGLASEGGGLSSSARTGVARRKAPAVAARMVLMAHLLFWSKGKGRGMTMRKPCKDHQTFTKLCHPFKMEPSRSLVRLKGGCRPEAG